VKRFWNVSVKDFMKVIPCVRCGESFCTALLTVSAYLQRAFDFLLVLSVMFSGWV
jgi:hypothetical protein